jgi:nucleoside-diphosphate-sugar epimerase
MAGTALVVGTSGIVGGATAALLVQEGWTVFGLARRPAARPGVIPIAADLADAAGIASSLAEVKPDAVFIAAWSRQANETENIRVNSAMIRNLLDALRLAASVRHVALVTGRKHYLGPFEAYGKGVLPQTPFREEQGRLDDSGGRSVGSVDGAETLTRDRASVARGWRRDQRVVPACRSGRRHLLDRRAGGH